MRTLPSISEPTAARGGATERGIALISVLLVMVSILLLGLGSLVLTQSNLLIAENLVATSIAKSHADAGIDATIAALFARFEAGEDLPASLASATATVLPTGLLTYALAPGNGYVRVADDQVALRVVGTGPRSAEYIAEAFVSFTRGGGTTGGASPFEGVVIGCEGVALSGSGRIDSYDSRLGPYVQANASNGAVVRTTEANAPVRLTGNAPIHGHVMSTGTFEATGSSSVFGDITASGAVTFRANATYAGDVRTTGDVTFTNTGQVHGSVSANGHVTFGNGARVHVDVQAGGNVAFNNSGARVSGDARAGGSITRGHSNHAVVHVAGASVQNAGPVQNTAVPTQECDPLGLPDIVAGFASVPSSGPLQTGWPRNRWELTPAGVRYYDETWNVRAWIDDATRPAHAVEVFGQSRSMIRTGNLNLGNGELRATGGDVVLFVDGDLNLGTGGGNGLVIDPGSTLTVFVTGRTRIASAIQMSAVAPVGAGGVPTFGLFSTHTNVQPWEAKGVSIEGNARLSATVYAPRAFVSVNAGGGMYGSARGKTADVTGGGAFHFDEALRALSLGGGSSGTVAGDTTVTVRSRR